MLGFSEFVQGDSFSKQFKQYSEILSEAIQANKGSLQYVTFSDSVVINTIESDERHLQYLVQAVAEITFRFLTELNVPICGSVSMGQFDRHEHKDGNVMIAGPPILDAYRYEQEQNWVGVILSPKVVKDNSILLEYCRLEEPHNQEEAEKLRKRFPWPLILQYYQMITFRNQNNDFDSPSYKGYVIVPQRCGCQEPEEVIDDLGKYQEKLKELMLFAPDPSSQQKYQYALTWIERAQNKLRSWGHNHYWMESSKVNYLTLELY